MKVMTERASNALGDVMSAGSEASTGHRIREPILRLTLVLLAIGFVRVAANQLNALQLEFNQTGEFSVIGWLLLVAPGVLAGALLGFAISPFRLKAKGFRWGVTLLLSLPPSLLLASELAFVKQVWVPPEWVIDIVLRGRLAIALMLGAAITAGFTRTQSSAPASLIRNTGAMT